MIIWLSETGNDQPPQLMTQSVPSQGDKRIASVQSKQQEATGM